MSASCEVAFTLNGVKRELTVPAGMSTLEMLRERLGLTGTKYGCGEGECGACTILLDGVTVNACLMFAVDCDGRELMTIEGVSVSETGERLRDAFVEQGAVQCGFCTPGLMVQASHVIAHHPGADEATIRRGIEGNLCRCTGYRKIIDAIAAATKPGTNRGAQGASHA
ncbi:MAG: (2Fe-2S)-binding protein [Betaproteobacteria bacterium]|nr:(2Fe-2S)-binding protein [Betaproteobacteria bacterium]